jgi:branched-chain amino acid transport system permease protein
MRLSPVPALLLAASTALPFVLPPYWVTLADMAGISALVALGLVVLTGFANITSFGQATLMGFGAYAAALAATRFGLSPWLGLPLALAASLLGSLVIGAVTLRLSGHYLALGTIAWSVALYYVFANLDLFGRNDGISPIPPLRLFGVRLLESRSFYPVVFAALALALIATRNLLDSRPGRALRALRGGAQAAASFGVDLFGARMLAFLHAGVLAGLAGWLFAHMQRAVNPTPFGLQAGINFLLMAVAGGVGQLWGALLGAGLITVLNDQLQNILPRLLGAQGNFETIAFGAILVLLLQFAPQGLWPLISGGRNANALPKAAPPAGARGTASAAPLPRRALPAPGAPILQAVALSKNFGGLRAVAGLRLDLRAGEIVGLIGPNGAGKSTSFNLLTGLQRPDSGRLRFLGADLLPCTPQRAARAGLARSFQHVKLVPGMSVIENVALGAHLRGRAGPIRAVLRLDRAEEASIFAEARRQLARVGLEDAAGKPADTLALGQQRVAEIARALCADPVLLLLDEPAAGLRHAEKQALADLLRRLRAEGLTILLVEHDMDFVMRLTDRLVVMDFGELLAEGTAPEIRANPAVIEAYLGSVA